MSQTLRSSRLQFLSHSLKLRNKITRHDLSRAFATVASGSRCVMGFSLYHDVEFV